MIGVYCTLCNWQASEASETLPGVYKFELVRYVYIYICVCVYGGTYAIIVAHAMYMQCGWSEATAIFHMCQPFQT